MNTKRIALPALVAAAGLALTACGGGEEVAPTSNVEEMMPIDNVAMEPVPEEAPPATRIDNVAAESIIEPPMPEATLTVDEQTQADAEASGMTARVSRDETGNGSAQPAH